MSRTVYLLEAFAPDDSYDQGEVVSLEPRVSYLLEKRECAYSQIEDYYSEVEIRRDEDSFFFEQLKWFDRFDEFLKSRIADCRKWNAPLARIHYNRLKYFVDSLIFRSRVLDSLFQKMNVDKIIFVTAEAEGEGGPSIYNLDRKDRSSYGPLLHLFQKYDKPFRFTLQEKRVFSPNANGAVASDRQGGARRILERLKYFPLKSLYHGFKYQKAGRFVFSNCDLRQLSILFLDAGSPAIDCIIRDCVRRGARVFVKSQKQIYLLSGLWEKEILNLINSEFGDCESGRTAELNEAFSHFVDSGLLDWINRHCGLDVAGIALPYFKNFIECICAEVLAEIPNLESFYSQYRIDYVIARGSAGGNYPAALIAAKNKGVKRVCFQHSVGPLDMKDWVVDEIDFFDINFAMNAASADYFKSYACQNIVNPCKVYHSDHYLFNIKTHYANKSASFPLKAQKRHRVFYVPAKLARGISKFNTVIYPKTWYYSHQKALLRYFGRKTGMDFVYKHSKHQFWVEESLFLWLSEQRFANVFIESGPFTDYLSQADRAIFDYPSTGFFEAAAAGIPVLGLFHETMKVWGPMKDLFGKSLQAFSDTGQAIEKMDVFLSSNARDYRLDLPLSDEYGMNLLIKLENCAA